MHRRHVLRGLVAGVPLFAGCSALSGSDNGGNGGTGTGGNDTGGDNGTTVATDVTETVQETATRAATATPPATATATATPTPTATPTATSTPTSTATPIPTAVTAVQTTTGEPTEQGTTSGATPGGSAGVVIDPSQLTTYSSETYPYSVKRPAGWTVDASDPTQVIFESDTGLGQEQVLVIEGMGGIDLDTLVSLLNDSFEQAFDSYETLSRRNVTLQNGNPAAVFEVTMSDSSFGDLVLRGQSVYTVVGGIAYGALILVLDSAYTSTVEQAMTEIVESLTIQSA